MPAPGTTPSLRSVVAPRPGNAGAVRERSTELDIKTLPVALALFEQHVDDVDVELQRLRQLDAIRRRRPGRRLTGTQCHSLSHRPRDDLPHWRLSVKCT